MSLTEDEGPPDGRWLSISPSVQERLLLFFRPERLPAYRVDLQFGAAAPWLCEKFGLRVTPAKLVELVKVWKYNALDSGTSAAGQDLLSLDVAVAGANHACAPSCEVRRWSGLHTELVAGPAGLAKGEEATIDYVSGYAEHIVRSAHVRRQLLAMHWLFFCTCAKCSEEVRVPACPDCNLPQMTVVVSRATAAPRIPNAICRSCRRNDLRGTLGYFYHCSECGATLCGWPSSEDGPGVSPPPPVETTVRTTQSGKRHKAAASYNAGNGFGNFASV